MDTPDRELADSGQHEHIGLHDGIRTAGDRTELEAVAGSRGYGESPLDLLHDLERWGDLSLSLSASSDGLKKETTANTHTRYRHTWYGHGTGQNSTYPPPPLRGSTLTPGRNVPSPGVPRRESIRVGHPRVVVRDLEPHHAQLWYKPLFPQYPVYIYIYISGLADLGAIPVWYGFQASVLPPPPPLLSVYIYLSIYIYVVLTAVAAGWAASVSTSVCTRSSPTSRRGSPTPWALSSARPLNCIPIISPPPACPPMPG